MGPDAGREGTAGHGCLCTYWSCVAVLRQWIILRDNMEWRLKLVILSMLYPGLSLSYHQDRDCSKPKIWFVMELSWGSVTRVLFLGYQESALSCMFLWNVSRFLGFYGESIKDFIHTFGIIHSLKCGMLWFSPGSLVCSVPREDAGRLDSWNRWNPL